MQKIPLFDDAKAKSALGSSILALATIISTVSTGLAQESAGSKLRTDTGLPGNQLVTTVSLGLNVFPTAIVVSPDSKTICVTSFTASGGLISIIDSQSNTVTDTISLEGSPDYLAISPDGSTLYVGNTGSVTSHTSVYVISTGTKTVTATIKMPLPEGLAVSPNGKKLHITDPTHRAISIIRTATNAFIEDAISVRKVVESIAVSPDGRSAYMSTADNVVSAVDLLTKQVVANISLKPSNDLTVFLTFSPDGQKLYLNRRDKVLVVDTSRNKIIKWINMPIALGGNNNENGQSAITPDGKFLYVPYAFGNTIAMVDTSTNLPAGNQVSVPAPRAIAVAPANTFAYAVGNGSSGSSEEGEVYVINISPE
jgi:YVTN family beta-propeller protein